MDWHVYKRSSTVCVGVTERIDMSTTFIHGLCRRQRGLTCLQRSSMVCVGVSVQIKFSVIVHVDYHFLYFWNVFCFLYWSKCSYHVFVSSDSFHILQFVILLPPIVNRIRGIIVCVITTNVVDRGFESCSGLIIQLVSSNFSTDNNLFTWHIRHCHDNPRRNNIRISLVLSTWSWIDGRHQSCVMPLESLGIKYWHIKKTSKR